jgi:hypothetical protein
MKELALRDNDALSLRVEKDLKVVLQDVQGYSSMRDLAHTKPETWLEIAGLLCKGVSPSRIYKDYGGNYYTIRKIQAQLAESPVAGDLKRELCTHLVENLQYNAEIAPKLNDAILEKLEAGEASTIALPDLIKAKRELGVDNKLANETISRLRGDNVQKIEVTHKNYNKDDYLADLKRVDELSEEVIDVED